MRVVFPRLPDQTRGYAVISRDDGVTYQLWDDPTSSDLPHDLVHFLVEDALGISDGIWGAIAGGVVFRSMNHVSGRRPPQAASRSARIKREYRASLQRAEVIGGFVERVASCGVVKPDRIRALAAEHLSTLPDVSLDPPAVSAAAAALNEAGFRWRALRVGEELAYRWPAHRRIRLSVAR
jgi:hypothetical protein